MAEEARIGREGALKLAVLSTHPIQYNAPLFREIAERRRVEVRVFYGWRGSTGGAAFDRGFGELVEWDIPLLEGYPHEFLENRSKDPGTHWFGGIDCPDAIRSIDDWGPDAILVYGWSFRTHLQAIKRYYGRIPVLFRGDSTLIDEVPGVRRLLRRAWLRHVYRHINLALYVGRHNREYFEAHGLDQRQMCHVPYSIDADFFADPNGVHRVEAEEWRGELGIQRDSPVILFVGKLAPVKAPELLLQAYGAMSSGHAHLVFCGDGPLREQLMRHAEGQVRVHFLGFQNQSRMPAVYRLGDLLVLPSRSETWGLAVNEALACGRRVVVSDRAGCAGDVSGHEACTVFRSGDVDALSQVLDGEVTAARRRDGAHEFVLCETSRQARLIERAAMDITASLPSCPGVASGDPRVQSGIGA